MHLKNRRYRYIAILGVILSISVSVTGCGARNSSDFTDFKMRPENIISYPAPRFYTNVKSFLDYVTGIYPSTYTATCSVYLDSMEMRQAIENDISTADQNGLRINVMIEETTGSASLQFSDGALQDIPAEELFDSHISGEKAPVLTGSAPSDYLGENAEDQNTLYQFVLDRMVVMALVKSSYISDAADVAGEGSEEGSLLDGYFTEESTSENEDSAAQFAGGGHYTREGRLRIFYCGINEFSGAENYEYCEMSDAEVYAFCKMMDGME